MTATTRPPAFPITHTGRRDRKFSADRGIRGRVHIPGSTRLIAATDGSLKGPHGGFGYVTYNGHWGLAARTMRGHLNPIADHGTGVLVLELRAVALVIDHFPGRAVRFLIDSTEAIRYLHAWQSGHGYQMPPGYNLRPRRSGDDPRPALVRLAESVSGRTDLRFVHVKGHAGHAMNEVADSLARIGRRAIGGGLGIEHAVGERASNRVAAFLSNTRGGAV